MKHPRNIAPLYEVRLRDLCEWHILIARCERCQRGATLNHAKLLGRFDPGLTLLQLARQLRCKRCGRRDMMQGFELTKLGR